jgi:hypothetical protein
MDPPRPKSGRVLVRMPIILHEDLVEAAGAESVSLNQFVCGVLAAAVHWRARDEPSRPVEQVRRELAWEAWRDRPH